MLSALEPDFAHAWPVRAAQFRANSAVARQLVHAVRNQLTSILGYAELLQHSATGHPADRELIDKLVASARAASGQCAVLVQCADASLAVAETLDVRQVALRAVELAGKASGISLAAEIPSPELPVVGDAARLVAAVEELIRNAIAASGQGAPRVSVAVGTLGAAELPADLARAAERFAAVAVRDEGVGMDAEVHGAACDPYFSTDRGKPGLGLFKTLGAAIAHGGALSLRSQAGGGTTACLLLPIVDSR